MENKLSKEEFMAKVINDKKSKEEKKMITKKVTKKANKVEVVPEVIETKVTETPVEVIPEVIVEVVPEVKVEVKQDNVLEYDKATKIIANEIHINPELKIVGTENASGNSYFSGKTRLFKLIKSKRGISLEINVSLSKEFCKEVTGMEDISIATAHQKHLGTMKHHYRSSDSKELTKIVHAILVSFKANNASKEAKAV